MTIIGFNFIKINIEKKGPVKGKINISNNVSIKDVEEIKISLGKSEQKALRFIFEFVSKYEPNIGDITLKGEIIDLEDDKKTKEITDKWKKDKKLSKDMTTLLLNNVLAKCNIQALILSRDINLPPPIPMPKVEVGKKEGK
jgi:hypothetical protein